MLTNKESKLSLFERTVQLRANQRSCRETAEDKRAEKKSSLLQAALESAANGIIAVNCQGNITCFNRKLVQMWQIPNNTLESRDWDQYLAFYKNQLKDPNAFTERIQELCRRPELESNDTLELKDGREFECYSKPQRLGQYIIGRVYSFLDITERRQAEGEIRQVEQEKERCEDRAELICMLAHEFRTPLSTISFSTNLLSLHRHHWSEEKKQKYFRRLQKSVEQLSQLMDEILIIGKAEAGKISFEPKPINISEFCRNLLAEMNLQNNSQHPVIFISQDDSLSACLDEKLLQLILTNLLENAIKYSPLDSTVELRLDCQQEEVIFQIKDRGIGISAADRERLFEPFYRGKNVGDLPGSGLGLAVVKKLVCIHGGQISVESQVGVGTTFRVVLPFSQLNRGTPLSNSQDAFGMFRGR